MVHMVSGTYILHKWSNLLFSVCSHLLGQDQALIKAAKVIAVLTCS